MSAIVMKDRFLTSLLADVLDSRNKLKPKENNKKFLAKLINAYFINSGNARPIMSEVVYQRAMMTEKENLNRDLRGKLIEERSNPRRAINPIDRTIQLVDPRTKFSSEKWLYFIDIGKKILLDFNVSPEDADNYDRWLHLPGGDASHSVAMCACFGEDSVLLCDDAYYTNEGNTVNRLLGWKLETRTRNQIYCVIEDAKSKHSGIRVCHLLSKRKLAILKPKNHISTA
jgi:hypothetical protein